MLSAPLIAAGWGARQREGQKDGEREIDGGSGRKSEGVGGVQMRQVAEESY